MKLLVAIVLVLGGCSSFIPTPEEVWVTKQDRRCRATGSSSFYDQDTKRFECWRHPIARMSKLVFSDNYVPPK